MFHKGRPLKHTDVARLSQSFQTSFILITHCRTFIVQCTSHQ